MGDEDGAGIQEGKGLGEGEGADEVGDGEMGEEGLGPGVVRAADEDYLMVLG